MRHVSRPQAWYNAVGELHRENDEPALIHPLLQRWCVNGRRYRRKDDLPSEIWCDGQQRWYSNDDKLHRDNDKPALVQPGLMKWYQHDKLHRDDDKPAYVSELCFLPGTATGTFTATTTSRQLLQTPVTSGG